MDSNDPPTPDLRDVMIKCMTTMGTPRGFVRVRESMVLDHGFAAEEARAWVIEQGGRVELEGPTERADTALRADRFVAPPAKPGGIVYFLPTAVANNTEYGLLQILRDTRDQRRVDL